MAAARLFFDRKPAQEKPWTSKLWIYDLGTNQHFTLKENTLKRTDLDDFVNCYFGGTSFRSSLRQIATSAKKPNASTPTDPGRIDLKEWKVSDFGVLPTKS